MVQLVVFPQIVHHHVDRKPPVVLEASLLQLQRLGTGVAVELRDVVLQVAKTVVRHSQFRIGRKANLPAAKCHSAVQDAAELKMAPLENSTNGVARPPAAVLHPLAAEMRLKRDIDGLEFMSRVRINSLTNWPVRSGIRSSASTNQSQSNRASGIAMFRTASKFGTLGCDSTRSTLDCTPLGLIRAFRVDQEQFADVRPQCCDAIDDVVLFVMARITPVIMGREPRGQEWSGRAVIGQSPTMSN